MLLVNNELHIHFWVKRSEWTKCITHVGAEFAILGGTDGEQMEPELLNTTAGMKCNILPL